MVELLPFQQRAADKLAPILHSRKSALLIGAAGIGKTYIVGDIIQRLFHTNHFIDCKSPFPVIYLTKSSVVPQTREVLFGEFKLPVDKIFITNYDQMRSTLGSIWVGWQEQYSANLQDKWLAPVWNPDYKPQLIVADECQALMNEGTQQSEIMIEYPKIGGQVLMASATPFARINQARFVFFCLKVRAPGYGLIDKTNWRTFSSDLAGGKAPWEYNEAAMERARELIKDQTVKVTGVRFKKKTRIQCKLIDFQTDEDRESYNQAYEEYLEELAKIDRNEPEGPMKIWVANTKFRKRAEFIKAPYLSEIAFEVVSRMEKQVIIGNNYIDALEATYKRLIDLGVLAEKISVIKGGQSKKERQDNIRRFQTGKSDYCLFTLRAGGVGLSLHHYIKNEKVCKPRYVIAPPTWSPIETVQYLGRAHRINSISETYQDIVWFKNTVEEKVAIRASEGLTSLATLISKKETWNEVFSNRKDIGDLEELKRLEYSNAQVHEDEKEEDITEEIDAEVYQNETVEKVEEWKFELVKD